MSDVDQPGVAGEDDSVAEQTIPSSPRRRQPRHAVLLGAAILGLLIVGAGLWLLVTALKARTELEAIRSEVHQLRAEISAGDLPAARATAAKLRDHSASAHGLTTGPVWAVAAAVPYLGDPADTVRTVTSSINHIANEALPALIDASRGLDPSTLREPDGTIDLAPIRRIAPSLTQAAATMTVASRQIDKSASSTWLGTVNSARSDLAAQLHNLTATVVSADIAARTVPDLLGGDGPRSYFVAFQNEAELRGLGGLPGAFAIVKADHGRISFTRFESDSALGVQPSGLTLDVNFRRMYGRSGAQADADPTRAYVNSDVSPHFPYAARIWIAQWERKTGQHLDGALTLDPTAVSYLLAVTGPARLPGGGQVSAGNVVRLTQQTAYDQFPNDQVKRKLFLLDVAKALSNKLVDARANTTALVRGAAKAVGEHRLLVYSAIPSVEAQLRRTPISGALPQSSAPYVGLAIVNFMASKLDYYLDASLDWRRTGCGARRDVTVTVRLTNAAPRPATLPAYVFGLYGTPDHPQRKGDNQEFVDYYATTGATMSSVDINGKPGGASFAVIQNHPVYRVRLPLPRGVAQTVVFHLKEPAGTGAPIIRPQPMVRPVHVSLHGTACG